MTNQQYNTIKRLLAVKELSEQINKLNTEDANNFIKWLESQKENRIYPNDLEGTEVFHRWLES